MHLINGTLYSLLLFTNTRSKRDGRRSVLFVKIVIYDRNKIPNSKELFFCEAVFGNCGVFVYFESNSILRPKDAVLLNQHIITFLNAHSTEN